MLSFMYVAIGGAVGSMARYGMMSFISRFNTDDFPYGTFAVNILGSFLMGVWIGIIALMLPAKSKDLHLLFAVGCLGGFTTFSTFTMDAYLLLERGLLGQAALYIGGSVLLSLAAFLGGMWLLRTVGA